MHAHKRRRLHAGHAQSPIGRCRGQVSFRSPHAAISRVAEWNCGMAEPRVVTLTCTPSRILTKHGKKTNEHHQFLALIVHFLIPTVHKRQGHKPHEQTLALNSVILQFIAPIFSVAFKSLSIVY